MSLKGLIFDLDGVIVFTDQYHYKAWKPVSYKHLKLPTKA